MRSNTFGTASPERLGLILIVLLLVIVFSGCSQSARKISYVSEDAGFLEPVNENDDTTSMQSKSAQELVTTGLIYLENENLSIAELHFATALSKNPNMVNAFIGLGRIELAKKNYSAAVERFGQARELDPESVYALIGEARAFRLEGQLNAAVKKINQAMAVDPKDINVLKELAMIYDLMGKENLSEPLYLEIVERAPDQSANHNNLGLNYMVRGQYPEAVLSFLYALALDKENQRIKNNLASAYLLGGDKENALDIFNETVGEAGAYNNIGYLLMTQGNFDEAELAFKKALQLNPRYYERAQENLDKLKRLRKTAQASQH